MTKDEALAQPEQEQEQEQLIGCVGHDCQKCKEMQDWEAVAADQAMTIALLRSEAITQVIPQSPQEHSSNEPVAWQWLTTGHFRKKLPKDAEISAWNPLYTAPPKRQPLTDEEIDAEANNILTSDPVQWWRRLARAVLAKSKEKSK
jgi:hypothetical protein